MSARHNGERVAPPQSDDAVALAINELGFLRSLSKGVPAYYQGLLNASEEPLRVAALVALLDLKAIWSAQAELVLANAHRGAVKRRAFPFFLSVYAYNFAERAAAIESEDVDALMTERMRSELSLDYERMAELDIELYMAHGAPEYLWSAESNAERAGGWRASVPHFVRSLLARPMDSNGPFHLLIALQSANQSQLVNDVCAAFETAGVFKSESRIFRATLAAEAGDHKSALKLLDQVPLSSPNAVLNAFNLEVRAKSLDALASFHDSYAAYQRMNRTNRDASVDPKAYYRALDRHVAYTFEGEQTDARIASHLMMVGFPRSGTTLLENALAAHPKIETFEETPAQSRMSRWLERFTPNARVVSSDLASEARDQYFDELARQSKKSADVIKIDKMPLASGDAGYLRKILPSMKYIFSIRHPNDVVLSCFRQNFVHNPAMENFRTIADAVALYDRTMAEWFSVHSLNDDPSVCYVRYEDLVQDFRPTLERVLDFIGVGWDDAVLNFVEAADKRFAKTPSYKKVRSGLSIGVQSSRENYKFLFETKETAVLKKWVKHFGYDE